MFQVYYIKMTNFWEDLPKPFFILAPMEAVTDVVFRHVVARAGRPDVFFTEFTNAASYASEKGIHSTRGRLTFTPDEHPMVAQIWGNNPDHFAFMARGLADMGYKGIDINMGCPDKAVVRQGSGSGLIGCTAESTALIAAAKEGGLPVSVKTRLGSTRLDEWEPWLTHLLQQDIANLTIHLRTRKEMSKVPAHFELIPAIKELRDRIAPQTLLTINGDIRDRTHGEELVRKYGVDGVMIGRGIFHNPFAFASEIAPESSTDHISHVPVSARESRDESRESHTAQSVRIRASQMGHVDNSTDDTTGEPLGNKSNETPAARVSRGAGALAETRSEAVSEDFVAKKGEISTKIARKHQLLNLLHYHLDLHDKYSRELEPRRFDPLKRFFKIYIREFEGAAELRDILMHTKNTDDVRHALDEFLSK